MGKVPTPSEPPGGLQDWEELRNPRPLLEGCAHPTSLGGGQGRDPKGSEHEHCPSSLPAAPTSPAPCPQLCLSYPLFPPPFSHFQSTQCHPLPHKPVAISEGELEGAGKVAWRRSQVDPLPAHTPSPLKTLGDSAQPVSCSPLPQPRPRQSRHPARTASRRAAGFAQTRDSLGSSAM